MKSLSQPHHSCCREHVQSSLPSNGDS
jgi:hypothetical protein